MPTTQQQARFTPEESQRVAALVAGLDTGNPNEAEATGKFRVLRRMVIGKNIRLVDALELTEIRKALDDQMSPDRKEGPALQQALEQAAALREELTARTRDVRTLAGDLKGCKELLQRRERENDALRRRTASAPSSPAPRCVCGGVAPVMGDSWVFQVLFLLAGLGAVVATWVLTVVHFVEWLFR